MDKKALSIGQNMAWNMMGSAIGLGCQWAISIAVVRLSANLSDAGVYSLAMSVFGIFSPIANFGMYTYLITDQSKETNVGEFITLISFTSVIALIGTSIYAIATCTPDTWLVVIAYSLFKSMATIIDILHAADQKACRMDYIGISLAMQGMLDLLFFCISYWLSSNLLIAVLSMALSTGMVGLIYDLPRTRSLFPIKLGITKRRAREIVSVCMLIVLSSMATGAFASIPRQTLSLLMGNEALGIYASIATPVAIIQVGSTYIYNPLIGYFAESYHSKNVKRFLMLLRKSTLGILAIGIVSLITSAILAKPVLTFLYGNEVAIHSDLLNGLILSSILLGFSGFLSNLLVAVRSLNTMLLGSISALGVVMLSASPLISAHGMSGATISLMLGCIGAITIYSIGIAKSMKNHLK